MRLFTPTSDTAGFFDITARTLQRWVRAGCPQEGRGKFDLKKVFLWWQENIMSSRLDTDDASLNAIKLKYWAAKAEAEELKVGKEKERLIPRDKVATQWIGRLTEVANFLQALPMRLPPLLEGKSQPEMRQLLDDEQRKIRDSFSRSGRFCTTTKPEPERDKTEKEKKKKTKKPAKKKLKKKTTHARKKKTTKKET